MAWKRNDWYEVFVTLLFIGIVLLIIWVMLDGRASGLVFG